MAWPLTCVNDDASIFWEPGRLASPIPIPSCLHQLVVGPVPASCAQLYFARGAVQREGREPGLAQFGLCDLQDAELEGRRLVLGGEMHLAALRTDGQTGCSNARR